jgi:membrane-bound lytic murein transglycosylase B
MRAALVIATVLMAIFAPAHAQQEVQVLPPISSFSSLGLAEWKSEFRARAVAAGISEQVFDNAFADVQFLPEVIEKDRRQDEFTRTIWDYLDRAVSDDRIASGRKALQSHRILFDDLQARFGVDREIVLAIWGLESAFGAVRGDIPTLSALASLAYEGRRAAFFEAELIALLQTIAEGAVTSSQLVGSWAGAMGHTQFMPSSYRAMAVDYQGNGRPNIWDDDPSDALASAAAYLAKSGWKVGLPWGVEVVLPPNFDYEIAGNRTQRPPSAWAAMGIARADGGDLPDAWASIILPAGADGPAFLVTDNFAAIETYNRADSYVIAIGHLADRLRGGAPFVQPWPRQLRALTLDERKAIQQKLLDRGLYAGQADGKIGPLSVAAIKAFQRSMGQIPDGYASTLVLDLLQ